MCRVDEPKFLMFIKHIKENRQQVVQLHSRSSVDAVKDAWKKLEDMGWLDGVASKEIICAVIKYTDFTELTAKDIEYHRELDALNRKYNRD